MDNITHSLFALTIARSRRARAVPGSVVALFVASSAPDLDIVAAFTGGTGAYLAAHRGATHGPLGIVGLGTVVGALVWLFARRRSAYEDRRIHLVRLVALSLGGVLMHVLMDLPTVYGTRLLSPFSSRWFSFDWVPIIDLHLWVALGTGLAVGSIWPAARARVLAAVLVIMAGNYLLRAAAHDRVMTLAGHPTAMFQPSSWSGTSHDKQRPCAGHPRPIADAGCHAIAIPSFLSPFEWRVIAAHEGYYELTDINLIEPSRGSASARIPVHGDAWVERAARGPVAGIFLGFARVSSVQVSEQAGGGASVVFRDLRFVRGPLEQRGDPPAAFMVTSTLDARGVVVDERLRD